MNRKSLLFSILILILGISLLAGCSGGNGKKTPPIEKGPSADYMGLQVGAVLTYSISGTEKGTYYNNLTYYYKVIENDYADPLNHAGFFKTEHEIIKNEFYKYGEYISKNEEGTVYYWRGFWTKYPEATYPDHHADDEEFLDVWIENPPKNGIEYEWGELAGTEPELVSVPAGKFKAWKFVDNDPDDNTWTDTVWFVPYLGVVKETSIENKKIVYEKLLIKYSF